MKVQATIVGKKPHLALPHRRLVCYCRLYEIPDIHKKERPGVHQREVIIIITMCVIDIKSQIWTSAAGFFFWCPLAALIAYHQELRLFVCPQNIKNY